MTRPKSTIAATVAALAIGILIINPASAAVKGRGFSDLSAVTHYHARDAGPMQSGHWGNEFSRNDLSAITHHSVPQGVKPMMKESGKAYGRNDLSAITNHN